MKDISAKREYTQTQLIRTKIFQAPPFAFFDKYGTYILKQITTKKCSIHIQKYSWVHAHAYETEN